MISRIRQRLARFFFGETLVTTSPTLLADLTDVSSGEGMVALVNTGGGTIYFCKSDSATTVPALTTANGVPITSNGALTLDDIGGAAVWAVASVTQSSGSGTRISGGKPARPQ